MTTGSNTLKHFSSAASHLFFLVLALYFPPSPHSISLSARLYVYLPVCLSVCASRFWTSSYALFLQQIAAA